MSQISLRGFYDLVQVGHLFATNKYIKMIKYVHLCKQRLLHVLIIKCRCIKCLQNLQYKSSKNYIEITILERMSVSNYRGSGSWVGCAHKPLPCILVKLLVQVIKISIFKSYYIHVRCIWLTPNSIITYIMTHYTELHS